MDRNKLNCGKYRKAGDKQIRCNAVDNGSSSVERAVNEIRKTAEHTEYKRSAAANDVNGSITKLCMETAFVYDHRRGKTGCDYIYVFIRAVHYKLGIEIKPVSRQNNKYGGDDRDSRTERINTLYGEKCVGKQHNAGYQRADGNNDIHCTLAGIPVKKSGKGFKQHRKYSAYGKCRRNGIKLTASLLTSA